MNRRMHQSYRNSEYSDITPIAVDNIQMYNPTDAEKWMKIDDKLQDRANATHATLAKYIDDINNSDLDKDYKEGILNTLYKDIGQTYSNIHDIYGGDASKATRDTLNSVLSSKKLLMEASRSTAEKKEAKKIFDNLRVEGKSPIRMVVDEAGNATPELMDFNTYYNLNDRKYFDEKSGKFLAPEFKDIRGRGEYEPYIERFVDNLMKRGAEGNLKEDPKFNDYLRVLTTTGMSPEQFETELGKDNLGDKILSDFINNNPIATEEFVDEDGNFDKGSAKKFITNAIKIRLQKKDNYQYMPNVEKRKKEETQKLIDARLNNPELIKSGSTSKSLNELGLTPNDILRIGTSNPESAEGDYLKMSQENVIKAKPKYKNALNTKVSINPVDVANLVLPENIAPYLEQAAQSYYDHIKNLSTFDKVVNYIAAFEKAPIEDSGLYLTLTQRIDEDQYISNKSGTKQRVRDIITKVVKNKLKLEDDFRKEVQDDLAGIVVEGNTYIARIGSKFDTDLKEHLSKFNSDTDFIQANQKELSDDIKTALKDPNTNIKSIKIIGGGARTPISFEITTKENKIETIRLIGYEAKEDVIKDIAFKASKPELLEQFYEYKYLNSLTNSIPVVIDDYKIVKLTPEEAKKRGILPQYIRDPKKSVYVSNKKNESGGYSSIGIGQTPYDALEPVLTGLGIKTVQQQFLDYVVRENASSSDLQDAARLNEQHINYINSQQNQPN